MTSHWDTPLGLATLHDKARARAADLREQADKLDAKADEYARRYDNAMTSDGLVYHPDTTDEDN